MFELDAVQWKRPQNHNCTLSKCCKINPQHHSTGAPSTQFSRAAWKLFSKASSALVGRPPASYKLSVRTCSKVAAKPWRSATYGKPWTSPTFSVIWLVMSVRVSGFTADRQTFVKKKKKNQTTVHIKTEMVNFSVCLSLNRRYFLRLYWPACHCDQWCTSDAAVADPHQAVAGSLVAWHQVVDLGVDPHFLSP